MGEKSERERREEGTEKEEADQLEKSRKEAFHLSGRGGSKDWSEKKKRKGLHGGGYTKDSGV